MTALATDRTDSYRFGPQMHSSPVALGVKAATLIYQGALCVNDAGVAAPGRTATGLVPLGVARRRYDNAAGAANAITGEFDQGDFLFKNSASGDAITSADVGKDCYIVDDQTVAKTDDTGARSRAGKVIAVNPTGFNGTALTGVVVRVAAGL